MKKKSKEKIALSIERALVVAALWTFFVGITFYYFLNDTSYSVYAVGKIQILAWVALAPFCSLFRDWLCCEKIKSGARMRNLGGAYNYSQASSNNSNRSFTTFDDSFTATNHSYHTHGIDSASIDLRNTSFHE